VADADADSQEVVAAAAAEWRVADADALADTRLAV